MPLPNYNALNAKPEGMLAYLKSNLILTSDLANSKISNQPEFLVLEPAKRYPWAEELRKGKKIEGGAIDVYSLVNSDTVTSKSEGLLSYICDYEKNNIRGCVLGKAAGFCFTTTMNGCTFGIGSVGSDGAVMVTHSNRAEAGATQRSEQFEAVVGAHGSKKLAGMLNPAIYRPVSGMSSTTIGVKEPGGWKFYFQSWKVDNGEMVLYGALPVPANQNPT